MPTTEATFGLSQIGQIAIRVRDLERAVEFYRETLGMQFLFKVPTLAFFQCGGIRVMLAVPEGPEFDHPSSIIYFNVDDIETAYDIFVRRGVAFREKPQLVHRAEDHDLWMASFSDVDENTLALMARKPRS